MSSSPSSSDRARMPALPGGIEGVEPDALDGAAARDHHQVLMVREFACQQHGRHALALLERQDIDDVRAARRAPGLRDEVALLAVDAAVFVKNRT